MPPPAARRAAPRRPGAVPHAADEVEQDRREPVARARPSRRVGAAGRRSAVACSRRAAPSPRRARRCRGAPVVRALQRRVGSVDVGARVEHRDVERPGVALADLRLEHPDLGASGPGRLPADVHRRVAPAPGRPRCTAEAGRRGGRGGRAASRRRGAGGGRARRPSAARGARPRRAADGPPRPRGSPGSPPASASWRSSSAIRADSAWIASAIGSGRWIQSASGPSSRRPSTRTGCPGLPTTVAVGGTSWMTTAPAPILAPCPTRSGRAASPPRRS